MRNALLLLCLLPAIAGAQFTPVAQGVAKRSAADVLYGDNLAPGWQNWSWSTDLDFASTSPALGTHAIAVTPLAAWSGLYLHNDTPHEAAAGERLRFALHGGSSGGQLLALIAYDSSFQQTAPLPLAPLVAGEWTRVDVPLADLGLSDIGGLLFQEFTGGSQPTYSLDAVRIVRQQTVVPGPPGSVEQGPALTVDASVAGTPIAELVYGANGLDPQLSAELGLPIRRFGGNHITRYNWQQDVSNRASDWFFENVPYPNGDPGSLPTGSTSDLFIEQNLSWGADTVITVPLIGWTPKDRTLAGGFSVSKYGAQQFTDPFAPDFGNGVLTNGTLVTGNDPLDTSVPVDELFVQQWVQHLVGRFGTAAQGGVGYYALDNEPMLWNMTHRDVHPSPSTYDMVRDRGLSYAAAIKAVDPSAQVLGPVVWGWTAYTYSALDWDAGGSWWLSPVDQDAHGGVPFLDWYLGEFEAHEQETGTRLLDLLDVHYYPQAPGVVSGATDAATNALRLRATKGLWDPSYVDESWIGEPVRLVPRLRQLVADHYPGTGLSLSEYSFGALETMNGALAQADVLGILGREGLDAAMLWALLDSDDPGAFAFRMYRNHDGLGGRFGQLSMPATSADVDRVSVYAAQRDDGALTVLMVNKADAQLECRLTIGGASQGGAVQHWSYGAADPSSIRQLPDLTVSAGVLRPRLAAESISLLVWLP